MALFSKTDDRATKNSDMIQTIYTSHRALLYKMALKYAGDRVEPEDVVQDAVVRLLQNGDTLRGLNPSALKTYLALTVRSAALNRSKHQDVVDQHCAPLLPEDADAIADLEQHSDLDAYILSREQSELLYRALERLPERDQLLLLGKYYIGLKNRELCDLAGCQTDSLRTLVSRARNALVIELEKEGITHG